VGSVVLSVLEYTSFEVARTEAPDDVAAHVTRSKELLVNDPHLMIEAILDQNDAPLSTMAVASSREAAEEYVKGDQFLLNGIMSAWYTHKWSNMFA
jgi:uncharacterized protein